MGFFGGKVEEAPAAAAGVKGVAVRIALRKLWSDHVIWTRQYIIAAVAGTPDAGAAAGRLLQNQDHLGEAIVPYFGRDAGRELTRLLKEHVGIAVDLIEAAKTHNTADFQLHDGRWTTNADAIAGFLSGANHHWPKKDLQNLLHLHLSLTKGEVTARIKEDWNADVKAFDDIFVEITTVSDALADGIVKKFPEKF
ncbi:MAG TPA: glycosyltransferase [Candidatus Thermoplasmatota archaeon]|nr:glycosyltransferase [Candidatus Thermoplasmatota archaeon]